MYWLKFSQVIFQSDWFWKKRISSNTSLTARTGPVIFSYRQNRTIYNRVCVMRFSATCICWEYEGSEISHPLLDIVSPKLLQYFVIYQRSMHRYWRIKVGRKRKCRRIIIAVNFCKSFFQRSRTFRGKGEFCLERMVSVKFIRKCPWWRIISASTAMQRSIMKFSDVDQRV